MGKLRDNWGPPQWAEYIREANGKAVAQIIETGKRLREAHDAFKREPQKWGTVRWEKWAEDLGYKQPTVSRYETIADVFGEKYSQREYYSQMPAAWNTLYILALACRAFPEGFAAALASGKVSAGMTRAEAEDLNNELFEQANKEQRQKREARAERARAKRQAKAEAERQARQERWQNMSQQERDREMRRGAKNGAKKNADSERASSEPFGNMGFSMTPAARLAAPAAAAAKNSWRTRSLSWRRSLVGSVRIMTTKWLWLRDKRTSCDGSWASTGRTS